MEKRIYSTVVAASTVKLNYLVPNGKTVAVTKFMGNATFTGLTLVTIKFGEEILFATHGDSVHSIELDCVGDGAKNLTIELNNQSASTVTLGGHWKGVEYNTPQD